tara:strand:+ start:4693 stop:5151 length:459 start_codon:yes stop_codon:yes gene_type:complete
MSKIISIILLVVLVGVVAGCDGLINGERYEQRKDKTFREVVRLQCSDYPYQVGEVIYLKPDKHRAVVERIDKEYNSRPSGEYHVSYGHEGKKVVKKTLIRITQFNVVVRYQINQEHRKSHIFDQDEPTKILHYGERVVGWKTIFGKVPEEEL